MSNPDCIPVVFLKNCEPELSYVLAELFNMCLKKSCFPDCWKVSSVVPVFKSVWVICVTWNYHPISLLSVVCKVCEKFVNSIRVDHLEKCGCFPDFWYGFRSSSSIAVLLTVVSDRIARAFCKVWGYLSHSTWYIQGFQQSLACWFSSQTSLIQFQGR